RCNLIGAVALATSPLWRASPVQSGQVMTRDPRRRPGVPYPCEEISMLLPILLLAHLMASLEDNLDALKPSDLPRGEEVRVDAQRREIRFAARVQHPRNKPCIDDFGRRIQAFVGCARADGHPSEFADHFVFLAATDTEAVYHGLTELGLKSKVHFSRAEGRRRTGRDFLQGDRVELFIAWQEEGRWVERR